MWFMCFFLTFSNIVVTRNAFNRASMAPVGHYGPLTVEICAIIAMLPFFPSRASGPFLFSAELSNNPAAAGLAQRASLSARLDYLELVTAGRDTAGTRQAFGLSVPCPCPVHAALILNIGTKEEWPASAGWEKWEHSDNCAYLHR